MKKYIPVLCLIILSLLLFGRCGGANQKQQSLSLTDEQAVANAKALNEEYNLNMKRVFNLIYGSSKVETDGYNRYIVQLVYQYENSNRQLNKSDTLFYFTYDPKTDQILFKRMCFWDTYNYGIGDKDGWAYLKNDTEFSWGIDPATSATTK